jgi:hypothetical protein
MKLAGRIELMDPLGRAQPAKTGISFERMILYCLLRRVLSALPDLAALFWYSVRGGMLCTGVL